MAKRVEVQKGPIELDMETYKNATYAQKSRHREQEFRDLKSGITLTKHTPKQR